MFAGGKLGAFDLSKIVFPATPLKIVDPSIVFLSRAGSIGSQTIADISSYSHTVSLIGDSWVSTNSYFPGVSKSFTFDGNGDYAFSPSSSRFAFGSDEFAIEMFVRPTNISAPAFGNSLIGTYYFDGSTDRGWIFIIRASGFLQLYSAGNATHSFNLISAINPITNNSWNYVGAKGEIIGGNRTISIWANGTQVASATGNFNENYTGLLKIATQEAIQPGGQFPIFGASNTSFTGLIDENIRITIGESRDLSVIPTMSFI